MPLKYRKALIDKGVEDGLREIFRREPWLRRELWGGEFWSDGYFVATVGERGDWSVVESYVQNQGKPKEDLRQLEL